MVESVSLLAASLVSLASVPAGAESGPSASRRPSLAAPRLTRNRRGAPRCNHGARGALGLPAEAAYRQAGGSAGPDVARPAAGVTAPLFIASGAQLQGTGERDQAAPIPLLLLTRSLLI